MNKGTINTSVRDNIATLTFFHPSGNSLPSNLLKKLIQSINQLGVDNNIHVIILQSEGDKAFCGGASFDELVKIDNLNDAKLFFSGFANLINAMRKCPKFIIGRAQGKAVGGGVGILAATDYCFATEKADIKLSELSIGIGPFVIAPALIRKMGISALSELTIDATNWKTAYWAQRNGLFAQVFDNAHDMDEYIAILTKKLESYSLEAMQEMKKVLWENTEQWDELLLKRAEISGKLALSEFTNKELRKFRK